MKVAGRHPLKHLGIIKTDVSDVDVRDNQATSPQYTAEHAGIVCYTSWINESGRKPSYL